MNAEEAIDILERSAGSPEPVMLNPSVLDDLSVEDIPHDVSIEIGEREDDVRKIEWEGELYREDETIVGNARYIWTRKYWYAPLGLEQYLDLVRRAVERRQETHGDVEVDYFEDDGAYIHFSYLIYTEEANLGEAYEYIQEVCNRIRETADHTTEEIEKQISEKASRLSGWGERDFDTLVDAVENTDNPQEKGKKLEELCSRLFQNISGLSVNSRVRTETEEIDLWIVNDSDDPRFRRETALILAECKNWTGQCGKNEFRDLRDKIEARKRRCNLGFLISWNGFKETITKEMLRGSREKIMVVPMAGEDIRKGVRENKFREVLIDCWEEAVRT